MIQNLQLEVTQTILNHHNMPEVSYKDIDGKDLIPIGITLYGTAPATAANYDVFFIADRAYEIYQVSEVHRVLGTSAGAVTVNVERLSGTEALDAGDTVCVTAFDLKSTINTVVKKRTTDLQNRVLAIGDRLALKDTGTLTAVAGLTVRLLLKPIGKGDYI